MTRIFASWNHIAESSPLSRPFGSRPVDSGFSPDTISGIDDCDGVDRRDLERDGRRRIGRVAGGHGRALDPDRELIESVGLLNVKEPHVRHIRGQLWEIRLKGKAGIAVRCMSQRESSVS